MQLSALWESVLSISRVDKRIAGINGNRRSSNNPTLLLSLSSTHLDFFVSEGEKELLAMLGPQPVYAPGIDGSCQVVIHFLLSVFIVIRSGSNSKSEVWRSKVKSQLHILRINFSHAEKMEIYFKTVCHEVIESVQFSFVRARKFSIRCKILLTCW